VQSAAAWDLDLASKTIRTTARHGHQVDLGERWLGELPVAAVSGYDEASQRPRSDSRAETFVLREVDDFDYQICGVATCQSSPSSYGRAARHSGQACRGCLAAAVEPMSEWHWCSSASLLVFRPRRRQRMAQRVSPTPPQTPADSQCRCRLSVRQVL